MLDRLWNFGWLAADDSLRLIVGFLVAVALAAHLGPSDFGVLGYIFGIVALVAPLAVFGLDSLTLREVAARPEDHGQFLGTALLVRCTGSLIAVVLAVAFVAFVGGPPSATTGLMALAACSLLFLPWQSFNLFFKAVEKTRVVALPRICITLLGAGGILWLIWSEAGLSSFVAIKTFEAFLLAACAVAVYAGFGQGPFSLRFKLSLVRTMLKDGFPLFLSAIAVVVYMRIDQVMLGQISTSVELGRYSVAVRFSEGVNFVPMALQSAFFPLLVRSAAENDAKFRSELLRYFQLMAIIMMGLAVILGVGAHILIGSVLGADYSGAIPIMWTLVMGLPFIGLGVARSAFLTIRGWLWTSPLTTAIGAVVNVILNLVFIPKWGGMGAAVASVIAYWIAAHGTSFIFPWLRPIGYDMLRALNPLNAFHQGLNFWNTRKRAN